MKNTSSTQKLHKTPLDIQQILDTKPKILTLWNSLTPLARNEWICWVTSVKKESTRMAHIKRLVEDVQKGKRRPCCWVGCIHRTRA